MKRTQRAARIAVILYCFLIFYASSIPKDSLPDMQLFAGADKLVHGAEYLILGVLLCLALGFGLTHGLVTSLWRSVPRRAGLPMLLGVLYGVSDELHQLFVPGRTCAFGDLLADALGVALGVIIIYKLTAAPANQRIATGREEEI